MYRPPRGESTNQPPEAWFGAASRLWADGADGIYAFNLFPGKWEVREIESNVAGQHFWRKIIAEYTSGDFNEVSLNNESWQGPAQVFESPSGRERTAH
jgi:hypothetical protein